MEIIRCNLKDNEIIYAQNCKVYVRSDSPPRYRSKRKFAKKYKIISTFESPKSPEQVSAKRSSIRKRTPSAKVQHEEKRTPVQQYSTARKQNMNSRGYSQFQSSFEEYIKPQLKTTKVEENHIDQQLFKNHGDSFSSLKTKHTLKEIIEPEVMKKNIDFKHFSLKNGNQKFSNATRPDEFQTYYWLEFPKSKVQTNRKLSYKFENLVGEVKHMKLPSSDWKIKIMVHKQEMVSVSFTNKVPPERSISVSAKSGICEVMFDNKKVILLGSPMNVTSTADLEILLDIMNDITSDSSFLHYL